MGDVPIKNNSEKKSRKVEQNVHKICQIKENSLLRKIKKTLNLITINLRKLDKIEEKSKEMKTSRKITKTFLL